MPALPLPDYLYVGNTNTDPRTWQLALAACVGGNGELLVGGVQEETQVKSESTVGSGRPGLPSNAVQCCCVLIASCFYLPCSLSCLIDRLWPFLQEERKDDWPGLLIMMKWMKDSALQQSLSKICKTFCCGWAWNCLDLSGTISERRGVGCGKPGASWWTFHWPVLIGEKETERKIYILHHNSTWQSI